VDDSDLVLDYEGFWQRAKSSKYACDLAVGP